MTSTLHPTCWNVADFGASAIAEPRETLELTNLAYKWILYPPGTRATIYYPRPGAVYDSVGIQQAIDTAHAAGGGMVIVPSGDYLIGPILLKSRVTLHLQPGARLWGSPYLQDYVMTEGLAPGAQTYLDPNRPSSIAPGDTLARYAYLPPHPGEPRNLISAENAEDVALTGQGEIHGQSPVWIIPWMNEGPQSWNSLTSRRPAGMLLFFECQSVLLEGVRIHDSPSWTLVFSRCHQVNVRGITIRNFEAINADGIDLVDSSNVIISDCDIHCTDDGICLKNDSSGTTPRGVRNVTVTNCVIRTWCNGLKIGTESCGLFEDLAFNNVVVHQPADDLKGAEGAVHIALCDGGLARNISFRGIVARGVECPLNFVITPRKKYQNAHRLSPGAGRIERVIVSGLQADGARYTSFIVGCPGRPVSDVTLTDISIRKTHDFRPGPFPNPVPACGEQYPSSFMFGSPDGGRRDLGDGLPAHGLYLRDVAGITVRNFRVEGTEKDGRPLFAQENCSGVLLENSGG